MRKSIIRKITVWLLSLVIFSLVLCSVITIPVAAAEKGFVLDRQRDIEISVLYEGSEPQVTVTGPSKSFTKDADYQKVERQSGILNLYIKEAEAGRWDVKTSGEAQITILSWNESLTVSSFTVGGVSNDHVTVSAVVKHPESIYYKWKIYAVSDFKTTWLKGMQILLEETSGKSNETAKTQLNVGDLPDGNWTIAMEASYTYPDEIEVMGTAQADKPITISGHTAKGDAKLFTTITDLSEGTVNVDWTALAESENNNYDAMLVSVSEEGRTEPVFYSDFARGINTAQIVDKGTGSRELTVRLLPLHRGVYKTAYSRKVSFDPKFKLSIDTPEATGNMMAKISYDIGEAEKTMDVRINGQTTRYRIKGNNSISVALDALTNNEIVAMCYMSDTDVYRVTKKITVRSDPPSLVLYGISDKMVTNDEIFSISGKTDADATLSLNGQEVKVEADGSFIAETKLELGNNNLVFRAESAYGVQSVRTVLVNRTKGSVIDLVSENKKGLGWIALISGGLFALVCTGVIILIMVLSKKKGRKMPAIAIRIITAILGLASLALALSAAYCFYMKNKVNASLTGDSLVGLLKADQIQEVADGLDKMDVWKSRGIVMLVCAAVMLVLAVGAPIAFSIISKKWHSRPKKIKTTPIAPPPASQPSTPEIKTAPRFCPKCGASQSGKSPFCGFCGTKLQ